MVVVLCVWEGGGGGGGDEAISKLKGAGGNAMPSHAHTCMCPAYRGLFYHTVSLKQTPTVSF